MLALAAGSYMASKKIGSFLTIAFLSIASAPLLLSGSILMFYGGAILLAFSLGYTFAMGTLERYRDQRETRMIASEAEFIDHISGAAGSLVAPILVTSAGLTAGIIIVILLVVTLAILKLF